MKYKKTLGDWIFDIIVYILMVLVIIATLYPLVYTFSMTLSDPMEAAKGNVLLLPKGFSLESIKKVLNDKNIFIYYGNTIWYTVVGTVVGIIVTCLAAYPLSRKEFYYRGLVTKLIMLTMFFSGGMIPLYIVVTRFLHLYNSRWSVILTALTTAWYIMVTKAFFSSIPDEIVESSRMDGASEFRTFLQIVMPVSKPIIAVLTLYFAVSHWNSYFHAMLYISDASKHPLSMYIRSVVLQNSMSNFADSAARITASQILSNLQIKYSVIVISVLPILCVYPFISGKLEKGLMIGSIKG